MRAMVFTASSGYLPTDVSPDSMTASAPSSTALATSDASARVGPGVLDHRLQHLGGDDDGFGVLPCHLDGALLHQRHFFQGQLDAEVAARDHDRIERQHDGLEVVDGLGLLQLGDDGHAPADAVHHLVDQLDVGG